MACISRRRIAWLYGDRWYAGLRMLSSGSTYMEIVKRTGVSTATIGRVNRALNYEAGGYKLVLGKLSQQTK